MNCDICIKREWDYHEIIAWQYWVCDNKECKKRARQKVSEHLKENINSWRIDLALESVWDEDPFIYL